MISLVVIVSNGKIIIYADDIASFTLQHQYYLPDNKAHGLLKILLLHLHTFAIKLSVIRVYFCQFTFSVDWVRELISTESRI